MKSTPLFHGRLCYLLLLLASLHLGDAARAQTPEPRPSLEDLQAQIDAIGTGLGGHQIVSATVQADVTEYSAVAVANCPPGKVVIGGGAHLSYAQGSGSTGHAVIQSYPDTTTSWRAQARTPNAPTGNWYITTYATCIGPLP